MHKSKKIILFILVGIFSFISVAQAGYAVFFERLSYEQGWLIPNDYTTAMNPPNCKFREVTPKEKSALINECGFAKECIVEVDRWITQWDKYYCSKLGMKIRTNSDGKKVSYFPNQEDLPDKQKQTIQPVLEPFEPLNKKQEILEQSDVKSQNFVIRIWHMIIDFFYNDKTDKQVIDREIILLVSK